MTGNSIEPDKNVRSARGNGINMTEEKWEIGDIIQIDPEHDPIFAACLMIVTEPKSWGAQGYCAAPDSPGPALAYYRLKFENGVRVGKAEWVRDDEAS